MEPWARLELATCRLRNECHHTREVRRTQIKECSRRAAEKIVARFEADKPSTDAIGKITEKEFAELNSYLC